MLNFASDKNNCPTSTTCNCGNIIRLVLKFNNNICLFAYHLWNLSCLKTITYQIWYDDPESLALKYNISTYHGLRGVGMWNADAVDFAIDPQGAKGMWDALPVYPRNSSWKVSWIAKTSLSTEPNLSFLRAFMNICILHFCWLMQQTNIWNSQYTLYNIAKYIYIAVIAVHFWCIYKTIYFS